MPDAYTDVQTHLARAPRRWLVTGAAGFISSNLVETREHATACELGRARS